MSKSNQYNRRRFMQLSAIGAAAAAMPRVAFSYYTGKVKSVPTPGFNPQGQRIKRSY